MTKIITFSIDKKIFDSFPAYQRAILVVSNVNNNQLTKLNESIANEAIRIKSSISLEDPRLIAWRDAFTMLGIKVRDFKPSIDALIRRILNDKPLGSINPIVDIGTVISLQFLLPAGAHPILSDTTDVRLVVANGNDVELGDSIHPSEEVPAGEIVLLDSNRVATRRWVWRQTNLSRINDKTRDFYLNIDLLDMSLQEQDVVIEKALKLVRDVFVVDCSVITLSAAHPFESVEMS